MNLHNPWVVYNLIIGGTAFAFLAVCLFLFLFLRAYRKKHKKVPTNLDILIAQLKSTKSHLLLSYEAISFHPILKETKHYQELLKDWDEQLWVLHYIIEELESGIYYQSFNQEFTFKQIERIYSWALETHQSNTFTRGYITYTDHLTKIIEEQIKEREEDEEYFNMVSM